LFILKLVVKTERIPGIFDFIPEFVRKELIVDKSFAYIVLSLKGNKLSEIFTSPFRNFSYNDNAILFAILSLLLFASSSIKVLLISSFICELSPLNSETSPW